MLLLQLLFLGALLVQVLHEQAAGVEGRPALDPLVYSIEGFALDRQYPNEPPLDHQSRSPVHGFVASSAAMVSFSRCGFWGDGFGSAAA